MPDLSSADSTECRQLPRQAADELTHALPEQPAELFAGSADGLHSCSSQQPEQPSTLVAAEQPLSAQQLHAVACRNSDGDGSSSSRLSTAQQLPAAASTSTAAGMPSPSAFAAAAAVPEPHSSLQESSQQLQGPSVLPMQRRSSANGSAGSSGGSSSISAVSSSGRLGSASWQPGRR